MSRRRDAIAPVLLLALVEASRVERPTQRPRDREGGGIALLRVGDRVLVHWVEVEAQDGELTPVTRAWVPGCDDG